MILADKYDFYHMYIHNKQTLIYGRKITPAEVYVRMNSITVEQVREVVEKMICNKPIAVAAYGPCQNLPSIEWFREKVRV